MKFLSLFLLLGLLASALGGVSLSRKDVHVDSTVVTVSEAISPNGMEQLFIEIDRIEDDLSDAGVLLAERDIKIALRFEVNQEKQVLVNGVLAPFGLSQLTVQAQVYKVVNAEHIPFEDIVSVTVLVNVEEGSIVLNTGVRVSTLVVQERVIGIQTTEVWQADVVQQIFAIQQDGSVVRFETTKIQLMSGEANDMLPPPPPASPEGNHPGPHGKPGHYGKPGHHGGKPQGHHGKPGHHGGKPGHQGGKPYGHHGNGNGEEGPETGMAGHHREGHHGNFNRPEVDPFPPGMGMEGEQGGAEEGEEETEHGCYFSREIKRYFLQAATWFHDLSPALQVLVAFAGGVGLGLIGVLFVKIFMALCCSRRKSAAKEDYKQNIKVYSLQYSAVPQEEEEKKEKKENAIQMV